MTGQQLKNSILQMAVQGKLVPQDPNDEPASVLLERIRAEKEQLIKEGKIKKEKNPSIIFRGADNLPYEKIGKNEPVCIADEVPFDIPESWEWSRIEGIFYLQAGKNISSSSINERKFENSVPCYGGNGVRGYVDRPNHRGDYPIIGRQGALCGNINRATGDFYATEHAVCVTTFSNTDVSWACVFLKALDLNQYATATAQPGLAVGTINGVLIPVPPVAEQKRIVEKLNELTPAIQQYSLTHSYLEELNATFPEQFKKSILQEAVQGKLVSQDPNDEPASVLLERIRAEKEQLIKAGKIKRDKHESVIFRRDNSYYEKVDEIERCIDDELPFEIPESWKWCRLKTLTMKIGAGSTPTGGRAVYIDNGIKFIRSQNVYNDGLRLDGIAFIPATTNQKKSGSIVHPMDILLNITGASIGRCALVPDNFDIGNVNQHVMIIRCVTLNLRHWLHTVLISEYIQTLIMNVQVGVSREGLSATKLSDFLIPIPPLNEQHNIVQRIEELQPLISGM